MPQAILVARRSTSCNLRVMFVIEIKLIVTPQHQQRTRYMPQAILVMRRSTSFNLQAMIMTK